VSRSAVKVGFQTPLAILPLTKGGGPKLAALSGPHVVPSPISSTFHRMSSIQHHPGSALSPFLSFPPVTSCQVFFPHPPTHLSSFPQARCLAASLSFFHGTSPRHQVPRPSSSCPHGPSPSHHPLTSYHVSLFLSQSPPSIWSSPLLIHLSPVFHVTSAHPLFPNMCPSLRTGLHVLSIRPFSQSRWQREKTSTPQKCRVGRAILNPKEAVIEVVGGG
jgi:hypothetical protein